VLGNNGTLVTYGAMSRKPLTVPYDLIVSKQLKLKGFWMSAWHEAHRDSSQRLQMINEITEVRY
jgi:trans-2-enoyl-CoA reductase